MDKSCLFCKIVAKEIPSSVVYEDDNFMAFLDINPVSKGHTLLIPKEHHVWMQEVPDELLSESFLITKKLMNTIIAKLPCDYIHISVVGEEVPHFHIHLIPRFHNDMIPKFTTIKYSSDKEMGEFANKIKS